MRIVGHGRELKLSEFLPSQAKRHEDIRANISLELRTFPSWRFTEAQRKSMILDKEEIVAGIEHQSLVG